MGSDGEEPAVDSVMGAKQAALVGFPMHRITELTPGRPATR